MSERASSAVIAAPPRPVRTRDLDLGRFGMALFLFTEVMFFAGLVSAFFVLRGQSPVWPPPGQPRLPIAITGANTVILLLSGVAVHRALVIARRGQAGAVRWLTATAVLGAIFLIIQGVEWTRLLGFGLRTTENVYGAVFYTLIGIHGLHVVSALIALVVLLFQGLASGPGATFFRRLVLNRMYWTFVVLVWPVLYVLLYEPFRR